MRSRFDWDVAFNSAMVCVLLWFTGVGVVLLFSGRWSDGLLMLALVFMFGSWLGRGK